ncbi:MAG: hypothetical protein IKE21_04285 [Erysipelotrichaceae bacterium]|nr:hypothetical protein [Erysipelotrichaceae bacterium]
MKDNRQTQDPSEKVELAKKIANQSKRVSTGYANVEATIFRFVRFVSSLVDRLIFSRKYLGLVSLILAILMYLVVNFDAENSLFTAALSNARTLTGVSVTARYNDESFELSGVPTSCQVIITGDAANVNAAAAKSGYCLMDLEGYTEGTHTASLTATGYGNNVSLTVTPSETQITLKRKTTRQFELDYDFVNTNQLDARYILGTPVFGGDTSRVNIRASQDTLDSIAMVKALIDVAGQTADFQQEAPLVAYDRSGQVVNAEIDPNTVTVNVAVSSPHKTVPITLALSGEVPAGLAIDSIQMDHQTTDIYAPEAVLAEIGSVTAYLDASTLISDTEIIAPITLPAGVSSADVTNVTLRTTMAGAETREIEGINIVYRNNNNGYGAVDVEGGTTVTAIVTGTAANIEKVSSSDIYVYIDVEGLEPGTHTLPLQVEFAGNMFVKCSLDRSSITLTLVEPE